MSAGLATAANLAAPVDNPLNADAVVDQLQNGQANEVGVTNFLGEKSKSQTFAQLYLRNEFPMVSIASIKNVYLIFGKSCAAAYEFLRDAWDEILADDCADLDWLELQVSETRSVKLSLVVKHRRPYYGPVPECMASEIAWIENNLKRAGKRTNDEAEREAGILSASADAMECNICYDEYHLAEMIACNEGHLLCPDCLRKHVKEVLYGQAKVKLTCVFEKCGATYSNRSLELTIDPKWMKKLDLWAAQESLRLANIPNLEECKYCQFALIMDDPPEINKVFTCENDECGRSYCRACAVDWKEHIGLKCEEIEKSHETKFRRDAEERLASVVIRYCNKCKLPQMKESGCNKVVCPCGAFMCYLCRETISGYEHFCQHFRTPGNACSQCTRCSLYEDAAATDVVQWNKVRHEIDEAALGMQQDTR